MSDHAFAPIVRAILTETATRISGIDPELEATLRDMASDYAGPQAAICEKFVHTDTPDMDWICACGHDTDWHNYGPSKPGGPCEACAGPQAEETK